MQNPPPSMRPLQLASIALVVSAASCGSEEVQFTTHLASDFQQTSHAKLSVFGVFRDGRMNSEAWDEFGPKLTAALRASPCEVAYSNELVSSDGPLSAAVDDYARANGVTDDLLGAFAPKAQGDSILLITIAGHPPRSLGDAGAPRRGAPQQQSMGGGMGGGGRRGMGGAQPYVDPRSGTDRSEFDIAASVYSIAQNHSIALISMSYSGRSVDEAVTKFSQKLGETLPGAACVGWKADVKVDEAAVRKLNE
jgi:hypothetical protein